MTAAKTVSIIGATGKSGMWAMKGALQRGYTVRVLARNPDKVKTIMVTLLILWFGYNICLIIMDDKKVLKVFPL